MAFVQVNALVKKVNIKPKGVQEIVLEVSGRDLQGQFESLSRMVDRFASVEIECGSVDYTVKVAAKTDEPVVTYTVDEQGIVTEVKATVVEQSELDLGLPKVAEPTKEKELELEVDAINKFILSGNAPAFDDMPDVDLYAKRRAEGDSYVRISAELKISSWKVASLIDEYRARVAPLAEAWIRWAAQQQLKDEFEDDVPAATDEQEEGDQEEQDEPEATEEPTEEPTGDAFDQKKDDDEFNFDVA